MNPAPTNYELWQMILALQAQIDQLRAQRPVAVTGVPRRRRYPRTPIVRRPLTLEALARTWTTTPAYDLFYATLTHLSTIQGAPND